MILDSIHSPEDIRALDQNQLPQLCKELRQFLLENVSKTGGHFSSNLGVVELTVAIHRVFDTAHDRLVFDVGHQAYVHKALTGRQALFSTLRQLDGLSGFPKPHESVHDAFIAGHASNSVSVALGMARARTLQHQDYQVMALIGDGALTGGLAYEGLNNASDTPNNLLIILNDNNMSIDGSVGGMKHYLHQLHTSRLYNWLRFRISQKMLKWGILTERGRQRMLRFNNSLKSLLTDQQNIFEGMNIRYFGPSDGHDVIELVNTLTQIKDMKGPKLLHIHTIKGKGFEPAEQNPTLYHAPGRYDPETGECLHADTSGLPPKYQDVFGKTLMELARKNSRIVAVTPAMATGCGLTRMMKEMPDRTFDVGIAEGHAVTFSGGMASAGLVPFCNIYSSFSQRAFDNIIHDVCLNRLNVVLCLDRAGLVGEDGPTHHGAFDLSALRPVPNITLSSPMDEWEMRRLMYTAQLPDKGPFVIRYPRGRAEHTSWQCPLEEVPVGKGRLMHEGSDAVVLSLGPIGNEVERAIAELESQGRSIAHYDMRFLKPIDEEILNAVGQKFKRIVTIEDGALKGGLGSAVLEYMADHHLHPDVVRLGLPDHFVEHGSVEELHHLAGIDKEAIIKALK